MDARPHGRVTLTRVTYVLLVGRRYVRQRRLAAGTRHRRRRRESTVGRSNCGVPKNAFVSGNNEMKKR